MLAKFENTSIKRKFPSNITKFYNTIILQWVDQKTWNLYQISNFYQTSFR